MLAPESPSNFPNLLSDQIEAFEAARSGSNEADWYEFGIRHCAPQDSNDLNLMCELAAIDLELSWKRGQGRRVEEYVAREPRLNQPHYLLELIAEEYRGRLRCGAPTLIEFRQRFPEIGERIAAVLFEIDREQSAERSSLFQRNSRLQWNRTTNAAAVDCRTTLDYGDFLLEKYIGGGGSGKVYRAYQRSCQTHVAVKFLKKSFQVNPRAIERFVVEAQTVARLCHPGIIDLHGLGQTPRHGYFLAMDWLPDGDLNQQIQQGLVSIENAVQWICDAAMAIQYAHEQGVIHCDLKPANLLLRATGKAVVTDFGLARSLSQVDDEFRGLEGTAGFMAPEQATSVPGRIGTWSDVYGLGAVLYALLCGHAPHEGTRAADIFSRLIANRPIPSVTQYRMNVPCKLLDLCCACLDQNPRNRPASAKEVAERAAGV